MSSYNLSDYYKSASEFEKIINEYGDGNYIEAAYYYAGKSYFKTGNYKKSIHCFNTLIRNYPLSDYITAGEYERCLIFFQTGYYKQSIKSLELFLQKSPTDMMDKAYVLLGRCYLKEKLYHRAIFYFKEAFRFVKDVKSADIIHLYLAKIYLNLKDKDSLLKELEYLGKSSDIKITCQRLALELDLINHNKDVIKKIDKLLEIETKCRPDPGKVSIIGKIKEIIDEISDDKILDKIVVKYLPSFPSDYAAIRIIKISRERGDIIDAVMNARNFSSEYPDSEYKPELEALMEMLSPQKGIFPNKIGCILPLTGNYELFGKNVLSGINLAVRIFNSLNPKQQITLVIKNNNGEAEMTKKCLEILAIKEGVIGVLGPVLSVNAKAILKSADAFEIPVFSPTASAPELAGKSKYFMRNCITLKQQLDQLIEFSLNELNIRNFVLLYPENKYGYLVLEITDRMNKNIADISLHPIVYPPESTDFKDQIAKINEIENRPIGIIITDTANNASMISSQIAFYEIEDYQLLGINTWNSPDVFNNGEQFVQGGIFCDNFNKYDKSAASSYFLEQFIKEYAIEPDYMQAQAYDTAIMIMQQIKKGTKSRTLLNEQLHSIQNFHGVSGLTSMQENGEAHKMTSFFIIDKGKFKPYEKNEEQ